MKKIVNKKFKLQLGTNEVEYSNARLLSDCNNNFSGQGYTKEEMKKALRLDSILEDQKDKEDIKLEDADFEYAKSKVDSMNWAVKSQHILDFIKLFE